MKALALIGVISLVSSAAIAAGADNGRQYIVERRSSPGNAIPFSEAVLVGDTLYVSGHLGLEPSGQAAADPRVEAKLLMDSIQKTVSLAGLTMDDFVSVQVYCTDLGLYDVFNATYRNYFHGKFPARLVIGVDHLLRGAHFEVQGIAIRSTAGH